MRTDIDLRINGQRIALDSVEAAMIAALVHPETREDRRRIRTGQLVFDFQRGGEPTVVVLPVRPRAKVRRWGESSCGATGGALGGGQ